MVCLQPIKPFLTFDRLFPERTVFAPLTCTEMSNRVLKEAFKLDSMTGNYLSVMGAMPLICSENVASPPILEFFRESGLETPLQVLPYKDHEHAVGLARDFCKRGFKIAYAYPPSLELHGGNDLLVPVALYNWLNDKANLGRLVDPCFLPPHRIFNRGCPSIPCNLFANRGLFVKACFPGVTGAGKDVLFCPDEKSRGYFEEWILSRRDGISGIRVEKEMDIATSWCLNLAVCENESLYLGAAIQLFSEPSKQKGSRIDPDNVPPEQAVALAMDIAESARRLGYLGIAGFDMGVTPEGEIFVFDLNFRPVSSNRQVLLHNSAAGRIHARISESWEILVAGPLAPGLDRISVFAKNGVFVPLRLYEGTPLSGGKSLITGMIIGKDLADLREIKQKLERAIGGLRAE